MPSSRGGRTATWAACANSAEFCDSTHPETRTAGTPSKTHGASARLTARHPRLSRRLMVRLPSRCVPRRGRLARTWSRARALKGGQAVPHGEGGLYRPARQTQEVFEDGVQSVGLGLGRLQPKIGTIGIDDA